MPKGWRCRKIARDCTLPVSSPLVPLYVLAGLTDFFTDATPFWTQLKVVVTRTFLAFWRSPDYGFTRLFQHIAIALIVGLTVR